MDEILEALRKLKDNPDDLSGLPQIISGLEEYRTNTEKRQSEDLDRITRLQDSNRNLLSQIPINTGQPEPPKDPEVTFEDAQEQLLNAMKNVGGN